MKYSFKKISIFALSGIFLLSALLCCCLTNIVEASESTPFCLETTPDTESSKNIELCSCDQSLATIKEASFLKDAISQVATFSLDQLLSGYSRIWAKGNALEAPPLVYDTSPLYIKHSILRI